MQGPVILVDGDDLQIFDSVDDLESYVEPVDVEDMLAFTSSGEKLTLTVFDGHVEAQEGVSLPSELAEILGRYLRSVGCAIEGNETLPELIDHMDALDRRPREGLLQSLAKLWRRFR